MTASLFQNEGDLAKVDFIPLGGQAYLSRLRGAACGLVHLLSIDGQRDGFTPGHNLIRVPLAGRILLGLCFLEMG